MFSAFDVEYYFLNKRKNNSGRLLITFIHCIVYHKILKISVIEYFKCSLCFEFKWKTMFEFKNCQNIEKKSTQMCGNTKNWLRQKKIKIKKVKKTKTGTRRCKMSMQNTTLLLWPFTRKNVRYRKPGHIWCLITTNLAFVCCSLYRPWPWVSIFPCFTLNHFLLNCW